MDDTFSVADVEAATGIAKRTLQRWHCLGYLRASAASGTGKQRRYTEGDVARARVIVALRDAGIRDMDLAAAAADRVLATLDPRRDT